MKLQNPLKRTQKREGFPMSLFPASKSVHTTLPIGRAVPVYCLDMNPGDKLKLDVNQVTRFLTLKQPVMQDYEVEMGAFYVPYVAFDQLFKQRCAMEYIGDSGIVRTLDARTFFNPATNSADRVHPLSRSLSWVTNDGLNNPIGSLFDHLGYSIPSVDPASYVIGEGASEHIPLSDFLSFAALPVAVDKSGYSDMGYDDLRSSYFGTNADGYVKKVQNFFYWLKYISGIGMDHHYGAIQEDFGDASGVVDTSANNIDFRSAAYYFYGIEPSVWGNDDWQKPTTIRPFADMYGGSTVTEIQERYINYVLGTLATAVSDPVANSVRFLAYMQIYADWFINQQYTPRSEFLDWVGCAYLRTEVEPQYSWSDVWTNKNYRWSAGSNANQLSYFWRFLRFGECLPVLWAGDNFNSIIKNETLGGVGTAVGDTIESHLYNRVYAKFKDVINRLGPDYRQNSKAVYGETPSDATLYRSQVIGFRKFSVAIGDVQQTSSSSSDSRLGDFAGFAVSRGNMGKFEWKAQEHGLVMVLAWVRPKGVAIVGQVDRSIFKNNYFDYLLPHFGGVGYQDVEEREVNSSRGTSTLSIGKRERYYEYMLPVNEVHGQMRTTLKYLNADRYVVSTPNPNTSSMGSFLYMGEKADLMRVFEDETATDPVAMCLYFDGDVTRKLPATIRTDF